MKSDILLEDRYLVANPKEMQFIQNVAFSNGFRGVSGSCEIWSDKMWLKGMTIVLQEYSNGKKEWGWSRWDDTANINDFNKKWRYQMNEVIVEMFPVTKEAVLVDKWFGREIDKPIFKMLIKGKEKELIEEAQRLENESNKKKV